MEKIVGFNRNIRLTWLEATAAFRTESDDPLAIRAVLDTIVADEIASTINRRKAIDILINIWVKTGEIAPALHSEAVERFRSAATTSDRLWLHYGLTLLYYPFFRETVSAIGQLTRFGDVLTPALVKKRLVAGRGQLGSLDKAVERVIFSLRDWGLLVGAEQRNTYCVVDSPISTGNTDLELWLLACILRAHPAEEMPFTDLQRLAELFPFRLTATLDHVRHSALFDVQRQSLNWDIVGLTDPGFQLTGSPRSTSLVG